MGRWAQRHRDTESLEERRLNGLALLRSGLSQAEVARRLVVTPAAVSLWKIATDQNGMAALRAVPRSGRPTLVPRDRLAALPDLLAKGALAYGFSTDLWTIPRIIQVTEAEWGGPIHRQRDVALAPAPRPLLAAPPAPGEREGSPRREELAPSLLATV